MEETALKDEIRWTSSRGLRSFQIGYRARHILPLNPTEVNGVSSETSVPENFIALNPFCPVLQTVVDRIRFFSLDPLNYAA